MAFNFSNEGLTIQIKCDRLSFDENGFFVSNLVSVDPLKRSKGFLSSNFVKPPVVIELVFLCSVDVCRIELKTRVGGQKSSGLGVFTSPGDYSEFSTIWNGTFEEDSVVLADKETNMRSAGKCVVIQKRKLLSSVKRVRIKIFRTLNGSVPALKSVDIWGSPSRFVSSEVKNAVRRIWSKLNAHDPVLPTEPESASNEPSSVSTSSLPVPEDFIDPITCEIMTIPMCLPSGNTVDLSTLEKFYAAEEGHGRGRSDPFTGVLFSDSSQPVIATELRQRLDKFLLKYSDHSMVKALPRTLGSSKPSSSTSTSTYPRYSLTNSRPKRDFDELLDSTLSGLPSFLNDEPRPKKPINICSLCPQRETLYKLPCCDNLCRACLNQLRQNRELKCPECRSDFTFNDVQRYHY